MSYGERASISPVLCKQVKNKRSVVETTLIKQAAWLKGQNPWLTIANSDTSNKKQPFIKVRSNEYWGNPKSTFELKYKDT